LSRVWVTTTPVVVVLVSKFFNFFCLLILAFSLSRLDYGGTLIFNRFLSDIPSRRSGSVAATLQARNQAMS